MVKKDTWFDAFFNAVTSSPEFKKVVSKDYMWDLKKWIEKMESEIKKASDINDWFLQSFDSDEVREVWNNLTTKSDKPYINRTSSDNKSEKQELEIQYFENKNPETWWFLWVAWMQELKDNLRENFIMPLKFKFLVEKLEKEAEAEWDEKTKMYKKIHESYKRFGVSIPTWLLFYGPPGTGKTFITKKLAQELWAGIIKKSVWEFWSSYIHQTSQNIKKFFDQAKKASEKWPIILFLDEIDSLLSKRTDSIDNNKAEEVSQFLQEFNHLEEAQNLIIVAATNRPDHLDSAILRSWRFDKKFYIWAPDFGARKELFKIYIEKADRPHKELDYEELAKLTENYVAADIEAICDEVARDASQDILDLASSLEWEDIDYKKISESLDDHMIDMEHIRLAIKETTPSTKFVDMKIYEEWRKEDKKESIRI